MTWEWAFLLSVATICLTAYGIWTTTRSVPESPAELEEIMDRLTVLEAQFSEVQKTADEAKKLLSRENLALSMGVRR